MNEPQQQMIIQDDTVLDEKMRYLMINDATVHAAYRTGELLGLDKMRLYMNIVILLADEKKKYFDMALDATGRAMPNPLIIKDSRR